MMRILVTLVVFLLRFSIADAQVSVVEFEQLESLQKKERRPVLVFLRTDWCKYCKAMENHMNKNVQISGMLRSNYYVVFLNGEEKRTIRYAGREFIYRPGGNNTGVHELAQELGTISGKLAYPSLCFLNAENQIIYQHNGYITGAPFLRMLELVRKI